MYKNAIFDVDGTLFDTLSGISKAVNYAFDQMQLPRLSSETLKTFIGPSLFYSFTVTAKLSDEVALAAIDKYREKYLQEGMYDCRLYDGVEDMLKTLKEHKVLLSVASSKPLVSVKKLLGHYKILDYFDKLSAPDFGEKSSEKAELIKNAVLDSSVVMVGDRKFDISGAKMNNIDTIGARYGFAPEGELEELAPTYFAKSTKDILDIILR